MNNRARILLVDDHTFICELLITLLESESDLEVVQTVHDAGRAIEEVRRLKPDIIVMDIEMPGLSVFDALRTIRTEHPAVRVVFLSAFASDHYIQQALDLEANGFVTKTEPLEILVRALRKVKAGGSFFSRDVKSRIVVGSQGVSLASRRRSRIQMLTKREMEILGYIAKGMTKKEVAGLLYISVKTVDQHCTHLMTKLDIHDRVHLSRFAIREGVVQA